MPANERPSGTGGRPSICAIIHAMGTSQDLAEIPRGNTCRGVNRSIIELLLAGGSDLDGSRVLDVPCGRGEFLDTIKRFFPRARTTGADLQRHDDLSHEFLA